jgi:hypothetical protein
MDNTTLLYMVLFPLFMYFVGKAHGTTAETKDWVKSARLGRPVIKEGEIFEVKSIGGGSDE